MLALVQVWFREAQQDYFGKKGLSVHGCVVMHWNGSKHVVRFIDQVFTSATEVQDARAVAALLNVVRLRVQEMIPAARRIIIQSDNAAYYKSTQLLQWVAAVSRALPADAPRFSEWCFSESQVCVHCRASGCDVP